jgi:hypothetical protein
MINFTNNTLVFERMRQIYNRIALVLTTMLVGFGCQKEGVYPIPNVPVNIVLNLNLPAYQNLNIPGGWAYVNGGSRGIVVYRNFNAFIALDRHTTVYPDSVCAVAEVDTSNNFVLIDPCSEAQYSITTGTALKEPAQWALKQYFTSWDGAYALQITN